MLNAKVHIVIMLLKTFIAVYCMRPFAMIVIRHGIDYGPIIIVLYVQWTFDNYNLRGIMDV